MTTLPKDLSSMFSAEKNDLPPDRVCFCIPGKEELIPGILQMVKSYCYSRGLASKTCFDIELALAESLNNAIQHGCEGRPEASIEISWLWVGEKMELTVTDPGDFEFFSDHFPSLPQNSLSEKGRGLFLIHSLMDEVKHSLVEGKHRLHFSKQVGPPKLNLSKFQEMETAVASMTEQLNTSYESISALFRFSELLATVSSFESFVKEALHQLITLLQAKTATLRLVHNENELIVFSHTDENAPRDISSLESTQESVAFQSKKEILTDDCATLPASDPLRADDCKAVVCPMIFQKHPLGTLSIQRADGVGFFTVGQINFIRVVSDFLGIAHANSQLQEKRKAQLRFQHELEIAAEIQQSLIPKTFYHSPHCQIYGVCQSAQLVGGDFFDIASVGGGNVLFVIADVMGKGVPAAFFAATLRTAIRARLHLAEQPAALLNEVHHQISGELDRLDMFITAQIAFLNPVRHSLKIASAGHCPPLHRSGKDIHSLFVEGLPLGVKKAGDYRQFSYDLQLGDGLLFLTDGLYEISNSPQDMLNIDGLKSILRETWSGFPKLSCRRLLDQIHRRATPLELSDDQTLIIVELTPQP